MAVPALASRLMLGRLLEAASFPLTEWQEWYPGRQAVGYLCSYVPIEIIHAAGLTPVRLRGNSAPLRRVDTHLQSFACALCRSTLDQALGGELAFLVGVVWAHACDTMQAHADLWRINVAGPRFLETVMQPTCLSSPAARAYLVDELNRFCSRLSAFVDRPIGESHLRASIALHNETRHLVHSLHRVRNRLDGAQFLAILDAAQRTPRQECNVWLAALLRDLAGTPARSNGPRLFLVGSVLDEPRVLHLIEGLGARVVGDDLCSGSRPFFELVGDGDPVTALADYYLGRPPCPCKVHTAHRQGPYLLRLVQKAEADGVIFVLEKYCEPYAFDYAHLLPDLERAGVPYLLLELEQTPSLEAMHTRIQAFVEILR